MYVDYLTPPPGTPFRLLQIGASEQGITHILFVDAPSTPVRSHPLTQRCKTQLDAYLQGRRQTFDVPLAPQGTAFQQRVWKQLSEVPYGATCSYAAIAAGIGSPNSSRAVGAANGRNPLMIVVPCHRVLGSNGRLTGYAGGLANKQWLLHHEQAHLGGRRHAG